MCLWGVDSCTVWKQAIHKTFDSAISERSRVQHSRSVWSLSRWSCAEVEFVTEVSDQERIIGGDVDKNLWSWRKSKTKIRSSKLTRFLMIWFHCFVYRHLMARRFSLMTWCMVLRKMPFSLLSWTDYSLSTEWYERTSSLRIYSRTGGWLTELCSCLLMVLLSWGGRQQCWKSAKYHLRVDSREHDACSMYYISKGSFSVCHRPVVQHYIWVCITNYWRNTLFL